MTAEDPDYETAAAKVRDVIGIGAMNSMDSITPEMMRGVHKTVDAMIELDRLMREEGGTLMSRFSFLQGLLLCVVTEDENLELLP
jgi:hypothetical protein